jgi:Flp pilus assembly protein TadG
MGRLRLRLRAAIGRFTHDERATTIVEFALLATPFFMLIFGIFELGLIFLVSTTLENAITASGRQIRTGEAQAAGTTAAQFKTSICNNMTWLGSACASNLNVDVRTYTNFTGITTPPSPVVNGAVNPAAMTWSPGGSGDIVVVRAYYSWQVITPLLNPTLINLGSNKRLISATIAFRNEPYDP